MLIGLAKILTSKCNVTFGENLNKEKLVHSKSISQIKMD